MSISLFSAASSGLQILGKAEKDAEQKATEANAEGAFSSLLAQQTNAGSNVATISGRPGNGVISATLINAGVETQPSLDVSDLQSGAVDKTPDARDEFLNFARKTPAEQMRAMVLADLGLTEEQLASLDAETRAEIEEKIRVQIEAKIRQEIEKQSGVKISLGSLPLPTA
ncbi:hypothetical protein [Dongia rigui]|uniref:Uncharacterized protein n=1 Tax=Dongia rigui TaxID=940149 RepID=A0ABU5E0M4_9PROT|nr:hypothetical protein [Dongia rigui]MDY0872735.1 hypothetical protein [Dongia rigui]